MTLPLFFEGYRNYVSAKGVLYADLFLRGVSSSGEPEIEQVKMRTFNEELIKKLVNVESGVVLDFDVIIKDAMIADIMD